MFSKTLRATAPLLVTVGFAGGVALVAACGGGGGGGAIAGVGGSQVVRHVRFPTVPVTATAASFATTTAATIVYTPAGVNDLPLSVRVSGTVDVSGDVATIQVARALQGLTFNAGSVSLPVGTNQNFSIIAPLPAVGVAGVGTAGLIGSDVVFQLNVQGPFVPGPSPSSTSVTFLSIRFELSTAEGVVVSDPSPHLQ